MKRTLAARSPWAATSSGVSVDESYVEQLPEGVRDMVAGALDMG